MRGEEMTHQKYLCTGNAMPWSWQSPGRTCSVCHVLWEFIHSEGDNVRGVKFRPGFLVWGACSDNCCWCGVGCAVSGVCIAVVGKEKYDGGESQKVK